MQLYLEGHGKQELSHENKYQGMYAILFPTYGNISYLLPVQSKEPYLCNTSLRVGGKPDVEASWCTINLDMTLSNTNWFARFERKPCTVRSVDIALCVCGVCCGLCVLCVCVCVCVVCVCDVRACVGECAGMRVCKIAFSL